MNARLTLAKAIEDWLTQDEIDDVNDADSLTAYAAIGPAYTAIRKDPIEAARWAFWAQEAKSLEDCDNGDLRARAKFYREMSDPSPELRTEVFMWVVAGFGEKWPVLQRS